MNNETVFVLSAEFTGLPEFWPNERRWGGDEDWSGLLTLDTRASSESRLQLRDATFQVL
jgi:hypothetical protein